MIHADMNGPILRLCRNVSCDVTAICASIHHLPSEIELWLAVVIIDIRSRRTIAYRPVLHEPSITRACTVSKWLVDVVLVEDLTKATLVGLHRCMD